MLHFTSLPLGEKGEEASVGMKQVKKCTGNVSPSLALVIV
jgi:hypothetical protein